MKQKLENAYAPDKNGRKEKLVLGISGLDSLVTAYLLKIQKYDLIAVTIVNSWDEYPGDQETMFSCHVSSQRLDTIKEFCHKLNIPLQIVKSSIEFKEEVVEPWIADKIQGKRPKPCWNCHDIRMKILYDKMREAGAKHFATGHYAKLFHHESHQSVFVHTSSDEQHDQSALLSRLPHSILDSLMLPLSDLTRKEVLKLAENFGIQEINRKIEIHNCLHFNKELSELLAKKIPKKLIAEGEITSLDGSVGYGPHEGVHMFTLGDTVEISTINKFKGLFTEYSYPDKKLKVAEADHFMRDKFMLVSCHLSEEVSWLEPIKGYVVLPENIYLECWMFPKTLSTVSIQLFEKSKVIPGNVVSVVKKKGKNSKVFLTGEVQLLAPENVEPEGEQNNDVKVDPILDF